jgi:hypothetical protein
MDPARAACRGFRHRASQLVPCKVRIAPEKGSPEFDYIVVAIGAELNYLYKETMGPRARLNFATTTTNEQRLSAPPQSRHCRLARQ